VLKATDIVAHNYLDLRYIQDNHGHRFSLQPDDLGQIMLGKDVSVFTTYALNHRHQVRIKQSRRLSSRNPIEVEIDENGYPVRIIS
jgi:hypothetical protein